MTSAAERDREMTNQPYLRLAGVSKVYPGGAGVQPTDLSLDRGQMLVLLGPSGCGKTTLLNIIAGLLQPDTGAVWIGGRSLTSVPTHQRNISMVFQTWALFPTMTVEQNVAFGLRMRGVDKAERRRRVSDALELVRLGHLAGRKPGQLSGGQQQRVALARAIVTRPSVLLLDEPLSSLDHQIRVELRRELRKLQTDLELTGVYVTHDHSEALALGDQIVVMRTGEVVESGKPRDVFARPHCRYTADFLSVGSIVDATPIPGSEMTRYETALGPVTVPQAAEHGPVSALCLRATSVAFGPDTTGLAHAGEVTAIEYEPAGVSYTVHTDAGPTLTLVSEPQPDITVGSRTAVTCRWDEAIPLVDG